MIVHVYDTKYAIFGGGGGVCGWGGGGRRKLYFSHLSLLTCGMESIPSALSFSFIIATLARVDSDLEPLTTAHWGGHRQYCFFFQCLYTNSCRY